MLAHWEKTMVAHCWLCRLVEMWWLIVGDVVWWRCGGSLAAHQTSAAWNPASPTMFLGRCKVVVQYCRCLPFCKWEKV